MGRKFGFSWSWRRATGISAMKGRISRATGIPLTKSGREKKLGRMARGFLWPLLLLRGRRRTVVQTYEVVEPRASAGGCVSAVVRAVCGICLLMVVTVVVIIATSRAPADEHAKPAGRGVLPADPAPAIEASEELDTSADDQGA